MQIVRSDFYTRIQCIDTRLCVRVYMYVICNVCVFVCVIYVCLFRFRYIDLTHAHNILTYTCMRTSIYTIQTCMHTRIHTKNRERRRWHSRDTRASRVNGGVRCMCCAHGLTQTPKLTHNLGPGCHALLRTRTKRDPRKQITCGAWRRTRRRRTCGRVGRTTTRCGCGTCGAKARA